MAKIPALKNFFFIIPPLSSAHIYIWGSEWGLVLSVIYPYFLVFTVKLAIFLIFTVLEKKILFSVWKETPKFSLSIFKFYLLFRILQEN